MNWLPLFYEDQILETQLTKLSIFNTAVLTTMSSAQTFHAARREQAPAIYAGQFSHWYTRKLGLVRKIFAILPNHLLKSAEEIGNKVTTSSKRKFIVYSLNLQYGLFTAAATDNFDVIPKSSFHRAITYNNQDIHEIYGNVLNTSKTVSIEAELKACQMSNKHIYHQKCQWMMSQGSINSRDNQKLGESYENYRKEV